MDRICCGILLRLITLLGALLLTCKSGLAQIIIKDTNLNDFASSYVMSVDEFIHRFNAESIHPQLDTTDFEPLRMRSILSLFDMQKFQVRDSLVAGELITFANAICDNDFKLDLGSGGVYAEANCLFKYNQQELSINLILVFERVRGDIYKWAIQGVNGLKESGLLDITRDGYINPTQHSVHFTELSSTDSDLSRYVSVFKEVDQLSFLLGMLKSRQISLISCSNVKFHFVQFPGYVFVVEEANRMGNNSGYLISSLISTDNMGKIEYINKLMGS